MEVAEYKVKFIARVKGLFGPTFESVEVYEAATAAEAIEKCREDFVRQGGIYADEVELSITDVEKI
ncbi:hypothetical protein AHiyo8_58980 [Arthrobacter sp. Hiyo8]|uniref:hypothetical protein n=1 Tax=Arthrobacter sp. Hiyo1 TaxID=1588020 RepID=UPI00068399F7|nr:hypothetical protein [Arthrobacter sp. Hiyo1]BAS17595.1 hypothetical protein AHiyo8_58980 [Arthrobacter sp. Hiyo8]GAP57955.1 hypothetical protein AHiyo1_09170 [Arthrobacter sp. Hiyo1]